MSTESDLELINKDYAAGDMPRGGLFSRRNQDLTNRTFQGRVIRILNSLTKSVKYIGLRERAEIDLLVDEKCRVLETKLSSRLEELENRVRSEAARTKELEEKFAVLDSVTKGLESIISVLGKSGSPNVNSGEVLSSPDFNYLLLENRFRGSEKDIKSKLKVYAELLVEKLPQSKSQHVLEVGAGRGEFLELLTERGISCEGLEIDSGMFSLLKKKGLRAELEDANKFLRNKEECLGGIVAFQVVEHMPYAYLLEFLENSFKALSRGGILLLETINTSSLLPLMQNYFRDPTHTAPLHPDTLSFLVEQVGFKVSKIHKTSAYPDEAKLQRVPVAEELPFRYQELSRQINDRIDSLNRIIFDTQDYAVEAIKE